MRWGLWFGLMTMVPLAPVFAQEATDTTEPTPQQLATVNAEMAAFGRWMVRLNEATAPAFTELRAVQGKWQQAMQSGTPEKAAAMFRPVIVETRATLARSRAAVERLDTPEFPALALPAEVTTAGVRRQMLGLNDQIGGLIDSFGPLLDAMVRRDPKAAEIAGRRMVDGTRLLLESQAAIATAMMVTADKADSSYDMMMVERLFLLSGARVVRAAGRGMLGERDASFAADIDLLAQSIDRAVAAGTAKADRAIITHEQLIENAAPGTDANALAVLRKTVAVQKLTREMLGVGQRFAMQMREAAQRDRAARLTLQQLTALLGVLRPVRVEFDRIVLEQARIMAQ